MGASPAMPGSDSRRGSGSTMPCCSRPVFATSLARWETVSMHTNFGNCATAAREPFMSPLTADSNGSGQQAAHWLADRVREEGLNACQVSQWTRPGQLLRCGRRRPRVSTPVGRCLPVRFRVAQPYGLSNAQSPFRVTDDTGREVPWVNRFLDRQRVRSVADSTLRG